ncbi:uncharacterized protein [Clytia hemisphaerica]|uniref:uncharacterized protein isoform X2 n=1 Tax=Clytia hemisphaerica TaxID=252671 RepID=UPI0034D7B3B2
MQMISKNILLSRTAFNSLDKLRNSLSSATRHEILVNGDIPNVNKVISNLKDWLVRNITEPRNVKVPTTIGYSLDDKVWYLSPELQIKNRKILNEDTKVFMSSTHDSDLQDLELTLEPCLLEKSICKKINKSLILKLNAFQCNEDNAVDMISFGLSRLLMSTIDTELDESSHIALLFGKEKNIGKSLTQKILFYGQGGDQWKKSSLVLGGGNSVQSGISSRALQEICGKASVIITINDSTMTPSQAENLLQIHEGNTQGSKNMGTMHSKCCAITISSNNEEPERLDGRTLRFDYKRDALTEENERIIKEIKVLIEEHKLLQKELEEISTSAWSQPIYFSENEEKMGSRKDNDPLKGDYLADEPLSMAETTQHLELSDKIVNKLTKIKNIMKENIKETTTVDDKSDSKNEIMLSPAARNYCSKLPPKDGYWFKQGYLRVKRKIVNDDDGEDDDGVDSEHDTKHNTEHEDVDSEHFIVEESHRVAPLDESTEKHQSFPNAVNVVRSDSTENEKLSVSPLDESTEEHQSFPNAANVVKSDCNEQKIERPFLHSKMIGVFPSVAPLDESTEKHQSFPNAVNVVRSDSTENEKLSVSAFDESKENHQSFLNTDSSKSKRKKPLTIKNKGNKKVKKSNASQELEHQSSPQSRFCIKECNEKTSDGMIECSGSKCPGDKWFHFACINMDPDDAPKTRKKWYCPSCAQSNDLN